MPSIPYELDYYHNIKMKCSEDADSLFKFIEGEQVYEFLAGLNMEFDQVRVQILGKEELSSLNEAFAIIRGEEGRRSVMIEASSIKQEGSALKTTTETFNTEGIALLSANRPVNNQYHPKQHNRNSDLFFKRELLEAKRKTTIGWKKQSNTVSWKHFQSESWKSKSVE